ncbi:2-keto-4-pentenoate hydratase/2-oxohepta-3-ene-1,7-dioic acid hydratase in catechol pathway [Bacillus niacini]|uniref:2-keto-4-pentenoate hydratase/2-oxohepta-3-ene-1,7-dioic acid hydratase in catechol pathway n=1 Tax=Neobacillus niacini TaxID=86668 RepID=A0A852TC99_9BACI|nr:fumarylacetoacetate hydrolase family protein [Neobacillus niacini]NYE06402.1 2-keto-4-pentenoate hydratase/2-oxohepta-3-ene-1,7-dioic acid hydratase in catechol pathway [Neobacillus niacini]
MNKVNNIYCVGRNYAAHAKELQNEVPTSPMLFSKPTHALIEAAGQEISLPSNRGSIHFETEIVIRMGKPYEKGIKVDDIVESIAIGIDFTLRDVQSELKKKGHPWLLAKGFPNSAIVSKYIPFPGIEEMKQNDFSLIKNEEKVQQGNITNMIFDLQTIIDFTALNFGLGEGDLIFTGTPEGVGPVNDNDHLTLLWGNSILGECFINFD